MFGMQPANQMNAQQAYQLMMMANQGLGSSGGWGGALNNLGALALLYKSRLAPQGTPDPTGQGIFSSIAGVPKVQAPVSIPSFTGGPAVVPTGGLFFGG